MSLVHGGPSPWLLLTPAYKAIVQGVDDVVCLEETEGVLNPCTYEKLKQVISVKYDPYKGTLYKICFKYLMKICGRYCKFN